MPNTSTTPASVASRLTDEEIEQLAVYCDEDAAALKRQDITPMSCVIVQEQTAAVLRDYVRMRKLENAVKESVSRCDDLATIMVLGKAIGFKETVEEIKRLLAEAEKGEAK